MTADRNRPRKLTWLALAVALVAAACGQPLSSATRTRPVPVAGQVGSSATDLLGIVQTLAAPEMAGRASGSPGMEQAARYIAGEFRRAGLEPGGEAASCFQPFGLGRGSGPGRG